MAGEDPAHLHRVRSMPCAVRSVGGRPASEPERCIGVVAPHHPKGGKLGAKIRAHDHDAIPMCARHHDDLHGLRGMFKQYTRELLRTFQTALSFKYRPCAQRTHAPGVLCGAMTQESGEVF